MILLSGQIALNSRGVIVGTTVTEQTTQVFENIKLGLQSVGANLTHVAKLVVYMTDVSTIKEFRTIRDRYIDLKRPPVSSLVEVKSLSKPGLLIEIEVTAFIEN